MMKLAHIPPLAAAVIAVKTTVLRSGDDITSQDMRLLEAYNQLRTDYVVQESWPIHASGVDIDTYDVATSSTYVVAHVKDRVVAGLRATRVSSLFGSLSYSMWQFAIEREEFDSQLDEHMDLLDSLKGKEIWDITRLVAETSVLGNHSRLAKSYSKVGLLKAMAATVVAASNEQSTVWIFTTTDRMLRFMDKSNIKVHVLATAKISETDLAPTAFCLAYPRDIFSQLRKIDPITHSIAKQVIDYHGGLPE